MSAGVLVRCDGSPEIGLGHVVRCLALARELRDRHSRSVTFTMRAGPLGIGMVRHAGFPVIEAWQSEDSEYRAWLASAVEATAAEVLVLDVRDDLGLGDVRLIGRRRHVRVVVIDDTSERRLAADDVFYPPVPQVAALTWPGFSGRVHVGWKWVLLRPEFAAEPRRDRHTPPTVLVAMGGSDPARLTPRVVSALAQVHRPLSCIVLLGPGYGQDAELGRKLEAFPHEIHTVRNSDVRGHMLAADLAVLSFGVTAYEAAACALPAVHLCLTDDHVLSSSAFASGGLAVSLGLAKHVQEARLATVVEGLLADSAGLGAMGERARSLVDGEGTARIARVIAVGRSE